MRVLTERLKGRDLDLLDGIKVTRPPRLGAGLPDPDEPLVHIYAEGRDEQASNELERSSRSDSSKKSLAGRGSKSQAEVEPLARGWFTSQRSRPANERLTAWNRFPTWHRCPTPTSRR